MTHTELILTLASAVLHALWNFWLKGAKDRPAVMFGSGYLFLVVGAPLLWTMGPLSALWGPVGVYVILSAVIHLLYRALLAGTYDRSDLSQAYPVIRSAPILIAILAVLFLQEQINLVGWLGIALTVGGIYVLYLPKSTAGVGLDQAETLRRGGPLLWALATMLSVTAYSIVDKLGVTRGTLHPAVFFYAYDAGTMALFSALMLPTRWARIRRAFAREPGRLMGVGLLEPLSYMLILLAFRTAKVSYVVSVRQVSVIVATLLGITLLREPAGVSRVLGAAMILCGVAALRLWG